MQSLIFKRVVLSTIFNDVLVSFQTPVISQVHPALRVVYQYDVLQRRDELGFESRAGEVGYQVREKRDIGSRVFTREVRFGSDDEMRGI